MKNFDEFEKRIKLNESELSFLNESETELLDIGDSIITYLEDHGIHAYQEVKDDALHIKVEGDDYEIKKNGFEFSIGTKHNKPETMQDQDELMSWWASFVPQYKQGKAEYQMDESKPAKEEKELSTKVKKTLKKAGLSHGEEYDEYNKGLEKPKDKK